MSEAPLRKRDRELTDEEIEEMLRPGYEVRDWALENPEPQLEESPSIHSGDLGQRMLTPETRHEANKDYVKAAATEVAANTALGGAGALAKAGFGWLPLNMETVKTIRKLLGAYKHKRAPSGRVRYDLESFRDDGEADFQLTREAGKELKELWLKHAPKTEPRQVALPSTGKLKHGEGKFGPDVDRERVGLPWHPTGDAIRMKTNLRMNLRQAGINPDELRDLPDEEFLRVLKGARVSDPEGFPMSNLDAFKKALGGQ